MTNATITTGTTQTDSRMALLDRAFSTIRTAAAYRPETLDEAAAILDGIDAVADVALLHVRA